MVHGQCHARGPPVLPRGMAVTSFRCRSPPEGLAESQKNGDRSLLVRKVSQVRAGQHPGNVFQCSSIFVLCHSAFCFLLVVAAAAAAAAKLHPEISHTPPGWVSICVPSKMWNCLLSFPTSFH